MENRIYLRDLKCYIEAEKEGKEHPLMTPNRYFDLEKIPDLQLRQEMITFIHYRGEYLTPLSIKADLYQYQLLSAALSDKMPCLQTFYGLDLKMAEQKCRVWLLENGRKLTQRRVRTDTGKEEITDSYMLCYLRKIYRFYNPEDKSFHYESDIWYLSDIPLKLRLNPTIHIRSIQFTKIPQKRIREEIKKVIYLHLTQKALVTVRAEITAVNRFCMFLEAEYPYIGSLAEVDRIIMEEYIIYTNTQATGRKSYAKDMSHLRTVFSTAACCLGYDDLKDVLCMYDMGKLPEKIYKVYSEAEITRLNKVIVDKDEQIARVFILDQMLGTRISEILTLTQKAVYQSETGIWMIHIMQSKVNKSYEKPINETIKALFDRACEYTNEKFGEQKYVFVNESYPAEPMPYSRISYFLRTIIKKYDLRDDNGELFPAETHLFRRYFGFQMAKMGVDDIVLAKLLGHSNTRSLKHYRRIADDTIAEATKDMREDMDDIISSLVRDW